MFLLAEGMPLYYMELSIGQRFRKGSVGVWHRISPYLDGLGIASGVVCLLVSLYYNVILSWCMIYFVNSFKSPLPWSTCPEYSRSSSKWLILWLILYYDLFLDEKLPRNSEIRKIRLNFWPVFRDWLRN